MDGRRTAVYFLLFLVWFVKILYWPLLPSEPHSTDMSKPFCIWPLPVSAESIAALRVVYIVYAV